MFDFGFVVLLDMEKRNQVDLRFSIWNFDDISHSDISAILDLIPVRLFIKGEPRNPKNTKPDSPKIKQNGWIIDSGLSQYDSFEDQMNRLLNILEPRIEPLKEICSKYYAEFSCALH